MNLKSDGKIAKTTKSSGNTTLLACGRPYTLVLSFP